ncbi:MAG: CHAT domain-containing protein [Rivularia sp. (in: cyanobacteria)]
MTLKISLKIGGRVQINYTEVLPVTLAIFDREGQTIEIVSFLSPLPQPLEDKFKQWQYYIGLQGNRRVAKNRDKLMSGVVNLTELANSLKSELNKWLGKDGWIDENGKPDPRVSQVLENFRENITQKEELQIIVQTEDRQLRGLPWQEWDTLSAYTNRGVEVAISATNFRRLTQKQTPQFKATARILVVFGDENLGFAQEEEFIKNLQKYGGEPHILKQPTRQELEQKLTDKQGWHIFFFAGHSQSDRNGRIGQIQINTYDAQGIIQISELKDLLTAAIQKKLQLAIFNSCDGLGLANQLTELSLPYCIVMREMVESAVARELLRHFLAAFVKDYSLFSAMNIARQKLQQKFEPGKSWLPVVVANPLAKELTWNRLFSERRLSWKWEIILGIIAIALLVSLPLSILTEFQSGDTLIFYAQLYPHLIVYPSLFLWLSLFASYRMHCMIRVKTRPFVVLKLVTIFFTLGALFFELTGNRIMLMEFKADAMTRINLQQLSQLYSNWNSSQTQILNIPPDIFNSRAAFDKNGNLTLKKAELESAIRIHTKEQVPGLPGLLRIATSYEAWRNNWQEFSVTRLFYALIFIAIISSGADIIALVSTILFVPDSIFNKNRYLTYLIICELGILLWVPFQFYSIEHTKSLLFSPEFKGTFAGLNILLYAIIFALSLATLSSINRHATKQYQPILFTFFSTSLVLTLLASIFGTSLVDNLFGMNSTDPLTPWFSCVIFFATIFFLLVRLIDLRVHDK